MAAQNSRKAEAEEAREGSSSEEEEESMEENEDLVEESDTESEGINNNQAPSKKKITSLPQPSSDDDDTESNSDVDLQSNSNRKLVPEVKPVSSKPMGEPSQASKKSRSKPAADAQPSGKRPADSPAPQNGRDSKKAKKKEQGADEEGLKKAGDDTKRQLFQRVWSEDDQIAILKGLIEHAESQGIVPASKDMSHFHDFIRKSLHIDASTSQLVEKIRSLKKKFQRNLNKSKNGHDRTFSKAHDQTVYDLSKKIWGTEFNGSLGSDNVKVHKKGKNADANGKKANLGSPNLEMSVLTDKEKGQKNMNMKVDQAVLVAAAAPFRSEPFYIPTGDSSLEKVIMNYGSQLITGAKKQEFEGKLKQIELKELEVHLLRLDYMREQTALVLESLKSPSL